MPDIQQEMDEALDALEAEHGVLDKEEVIEAVAEEVTEEIVEEEPKEKPPGYLSYDEWVAKGKDPADYKGENAYKAEYERIHEIRDLKDTMKQVVSGVESWQQQQNDLMAEQIAQAKIDARAELEQALENDDTAAAVAAKDKLHNLDSKQAAQPVQINPIISDFARKNPIIDTNSTQYDADFHEDMIMIHNGKLDQLLGGDRTRANELTQQQIERVQKMAFTQAKELHPNKFVSPRNRRPAPATPNKRPVNNSGDTGAKLKSVTGNSRNPRDANPANDIYEILKERDPKAAETFAKNMIGEQ